MPVELPFTYRAENQQPPPPPPPNKKKKQKKKKKKKKKKNPTNVLDLVTKELEKTNSNNYDKTLPFL